MTSSPADDYRMTRIINTFDQQLLKNDPLNRTSFFLCPAPGGGLWLTESNITEEETWFLSCASELQTSLHLLNSVWLVRRRYRCNWQETQVCFSVISAAGFSRAAHAPEPSAGLCCYLIRRSTFLCFTPEHRKWRFKLFQIKTRLTRIYLTNHVSKHQCLIGLIPLRLITHQDNFLLLWSPGVIDHLRENAHICPVQRDSSQKPIIPLNNRNTSNRLSFFLFLLEIYE